MRFSAKKALTVTAVSFFLFAMGLGSSIAYADGCASMKICRANSVKYTSGGVGKGEREILEIRARDYNLKIIFALQNGEYLSSVPVEIYGPGGKVLLNTVSKGPWFYADLPPGNYKVTTVHEGKKKVKVVEAGKGLTVVFFHWKL